MSLNRVHLSLFFTWIRRLFFGVHEQFDNFQLFVCVYSSKPAVAISTKGRRIQNNLDVLQVRAISVDDKIGHLDTPVSPIKVISSLAIVLRPRWFTNSSHLNGDINITQQCYSLSFSCFLCMSDFQLCASSISRRSPCLKVAESCWREISLYL